MKKSQKNIHFEIIIEKIDRLLERSEKRERLDSDEVLVLLYEIKAMAKRGMK